jgi:hypothetical protein
VPVCSLVNRNSYFFVSTFVRGGNRVGQVGLGQFDFLEEIGPGRVNLYVVFFQIVDRF